MADVNVYFDALFGDVAMLITNISTDGGRDIAVQSPSRGDRHVLQDRGRRMRSATADILFIDQPGKDPYLDRYDAFKALVEQGDAQIFSHPLDGSYRARASELHVQASSDSLAVAVTCTFLAEDEPQTVFPIGAGTSAAAGLEAVTAAAGATTAALTDASLPTSIADSVLAAVTDWSTLDGLDSQQVFLGVASLTQQISDMIDAYDLASDITRWPAYQALVGLGYQLSRAGEALTADSGQLFEITVARPLPLLAICAEVYGATAAVDRADQVAKINRIRTPGRVPAGTVLKMPPRAS